MDECGESSPKRMRMCVGQNHEALNLTISEFHRATKKPAAEESVDNRKFAQSNILEMKCKFQQWVLETYRDASKTKTITSKKYERIVKTLRGEIKNCAENSKFRFWMKCKGFKLETEGDNKTLYVLDKKDESIKYKKVAIVENFFDIIYDVHVNEGARGIQHAGQKRTHKSITETYAFLPREAVTKFLLCCTDCQKRITEDRKNSPLASSSSSHDSTLQNSSTINDNSNSLNELSNNKPITDDKVIFECYPQPKAEPYEHRSTDVSVPTNRKTYENNNNIFNEIKDCIETINVPINSNANLNESITGENCRPVIASDVNDDFNTDRLRIRKRKRKFTRKIVRPRITNVDQCDVTYDGTSVEFITSTPRQNCDNEVNFVGHRIESSNDSLIQNMQPLMGQNTEFFSQKFPPNESESTFAENIPQSGPMENTPSEFINRTAPEAKSNYNSTRFCPYLTKLSEIIFNPVKYAVSRKRKNFISISNEEDFLEQQAVNLVLKAQELGGVESKLTENEKQQISHKVYNFRIISFLLNYAADLMLRSLDREI